MGLHKAAEYEENVYPRWRADLKASTSRTLLLHGIMGGELFDLRRGFGGDTVWVDLGLPFDQACLPFSDLTPNGAHDAQGSMILARSTVKLPLLGDYYNKIRRHPTIRAAAFAFDWRESMPIEAKRLASFLKHPDIMSGGPINFVAHSMGGCLLMWLLGTTDEHDGLIKSITFCAPPFRGALAPLRVIEHGNGTPADIAISDNLLQKAAATFPGLFQLLCAPDELWAPKMPKPGGGKVDVNYPTFGSTTNLYASGSYWNQYFSQWRNKILSFALEFHRSQELHMAAVTERLRDKIRVIVGLNGKTDFAAHLDPNTGWTVLSHRDPPAGELNNGDGTVLFQSSFLPKLPQDHHLAFEPSRGPRNTHGSILDQDAVLQAITRIVTTKKGKELPSNFAGLTKYSSFISRIDWSKEQASEPPKTEGLLDHRERARLRSLSERRSWGSLNPSGKTVDDALDYFLTREAAANVLRGADVEREAERIGVPAEFLRGFAVRTIAPLLG